MTKSIRSLMVLSGLVLLAGSMAFAETGADVYKTKCASCHGVAGTPNAGMAKMMGIKAAGDAEYKKLTVDQIAAAVKGGKGKMKAVAGLSDAQVKEVSTYFHSLK